MSATKRRRVLGIIATDATFERTWFREHEVWLGKCLHCNAHLRVSLQGEPISRATIDDPRYLKDARAQELVARLQARRRERWRDPEAD